MPDSPSYSYTLGPPTTLYRLFDEFGRLLYVGITSSGPARFDQHARSKPWWPTVSSIQLDHHENRRAALAAERAAIASEAPLYNLVGAPDYRPFRRYPDEVTDA